MTYPQIVDKQKHLTGSGQQSVHDFKTLKVSNTAV